MLRRRERLTKLLLYGIVLPLQYLVIGTPFSTQLVGVEPVVRELVSEPFESLFSVDVQVDFGSPYFGLLLEVLDLCDECDGCGRRRIW